MTVQSVTGAPAGGASSAATSAAGADSLSLGKDSFLQLLLTQLRYQDPLKPMEDQDFIAQLAQLNTLEELQSLNRSFGEFMQQQNVMRGAELLGRSVVGATADGTPVSGLVSSVAVRGGQVLLTVGGREVPLSGVTAIEEG